MVALHHHVHSEGRIVKIVKKAVYIAIGIGLGGFSAAIEALFPKTEIQNCVVHQLRNSGKYVS